jgi:hypothetical protein
MSIDFTISRTVKDMTFAQRLLHNAIWWGIPLLLLELWGIPWGSWIFILLIGLLPTALGVLCTAALQHIYFSQKKSSQSSTDNPREPKEPG